MSEENKICNFRQRKRGGKAEVSFTKKQAKSPSIFV